MKAMMLTGIRKMEMMEVPEPQIIHADDVKIRMVVVGICGSDIHYFTQGNIGSQKVDFPLTLGHEGAGVVVETGPAVTKVRPGDLIAIEPAMPCGECDQCLAGRSHTCRKIKFLGCPNQAEGCLSEYLVMPEENCFKLPDNLNPDHGSISEPLAIGVYSVKKAGDIKNLKAGILGFGPIGMSVLLALQAKGAGDIYVTDKIDERLAIASKENAVYTGNPMKSNIAEQIRQMEPQGLDIVFECCGQQEAIDQAVDIMKPGGKIIIAGIPEFERWSLNVENTRRKEIMIQFIRRQVDCTQDAIDHMHSGQIDVSNMVTHHFPFEWTYEAFELVAGYRDGVMKAMIDISR
ncbi:MAG TPA: alcohol dehydrogenase catalytic domain-containing protein [Bacteroidales bacterium]|nr:alcohol dehydrogenase catalytic domain-containing protein [Bacteroidales bacterium]HPJ60065.1 alcohol dehydrogenase catalytic domain-containing protein [Bacteroidales bacterium]HPR11731.1 alcohol dehydrogenase catalytic domain-containing protein [Bacteroidales bacterium]HRW85461.1 alcohol dehydrogenase catalytic domain-containing protein [Bacteroidales bacterium]